MTLRSDLLPHAMMVLTLQAKQAAKEGGGDDNKTKKK